MSGLRLSGGEDYIPSAEITQRTQEMGDHFAKYFDGEEIVLMTVLQGASHFASDLGRAIARRNTRIIADRVEIKTMDGTESSLEPSIKVDWREKKVGKNFLIVEDIYHTGKTLDYLISGIRLYDPARIAVAALVDKPTARAAGHTLDCDELEVGFQVVDEYVVGGGLDWNDEHRFLPHITKAKNIGGEAKEDQIWVPIVEFEPDDTQTHKQSLSLNGSLLHLPSSALVAGL